MTNWPVSTRSAIPPGTASGTARGGEWWSRWPAPTSRPAPSAATTRRPTSERAAAHRLRARRPGVRRPLRQADTLRGPSGHHAPALCGAHAHVRHRHADDGGAARAVLESVAGRLDLRVATGALLPLP